MRTIRLVHECFLLTALWNFRHYQSYNLTQREYCVVVCLWRRPQKHLDLETEHSYAPRQRWSVGRLHETFHSLCVFGHWLVLVHWRWAVSCLLVSTHMVRITHLLLVTSLDYFIKKQQSVFVAWKLWSSAPTFVAFGTSGAKCLHSEMFLLKSQWLIPDTSFELQAWYRHMQHVASGLWKQREKRRRENYKTSTVGD